MDGRRYRRVGPELVEVRKLTREQAAAAVDRLCTVKKVETRNELEATPVSVRLGFAPDAKGRSKEVLLPVKKVTTEHNIAALRELYDRCRNSNLVSQAALHKKYMQSLRPAAKKLRDADLEDHLRKMDLLHKGMGVGQA
eukprot:jgi/Botrbrau1/22965/Bobra.0030s0037.1